MTKSTNPEIYNTQEIGFNHLTLNTGNNLFQTQKYFTPDPILNSQLKELMQGAMSPEGTTLIDNITFKANRDADWYAGMLLFNSGTDKIPLLTTFGAKTEEVADAIWKMLQEKYSGNDALIGLWKARPHAPLVVDIVYNCLFDADAFFFFISGMSADFCKCLGWTFLFPEIFKADGRASGVR